MIKSKGFTLIEVLLALGIMSIATVFLISGVYNVEKLSHENQRALEMDKILQSNMEMLLCEVDKISNTSFYFEDYLVEVLLEPFENTNLTTLQLIITSTSGDMIRAGVIYNPNIH